MDTKAPAAARSHDDPLRWLTSPKGVLAAVAAAVIGLGVATAAGVRAAPHPPAAVVAPAVRAAPPVLQVGVPYAAGNWETTVLESRRMKEIKAKFTSAVAKGEFVVVGLELKNIGRENFGVNAWDYELYDGAGIKYRSASVYVMDWEQALGYEGEVGTDTRQLPPGVPGKYALAFDVAPNAEGLRLRVVQTGAEIPL